MRQFFIIASIFAMALGYRTLTLSEGVLLHPLDLTLWGYAFVAAAQGRPVLSATPKALLLVLLFSALSMVGSPMPASVLISEMKALMLIIPVFALVREVLESPSFTAKALIVFLKVTFFTAVMGVFEYHFPRVASAIPLFTNPEASLSYGGFSRAKYSFFGNQIASILPVFGFGLLPYYRQYFSKRNYYGIFIILAYGILIGGYRSFWAVTLVAVLINLWFNKQRKILILLSLLLFFISAFGIRFIPQSIGVRFLSAFSALGGEASLGEGSGDLRMRMIKNVLDWDKLTEYFLGHGLGAAGWTHSDILMVAYNSGLLTALILVFFLLFTFRRVWGNARRPQANTLGKGLLALVPAVIMIFTFQAFIVLPQLAVPLYFILALMWYYPKIQLIHYLPESIQLSPDWR